METELKKIKACLEEGIEIPPSSAQRFHRISNELKRKQREIEVTKRELAATIKKNLEPHQLFQLQEFIPCIIPPKGELRIGQAGDNKGLTRKLEKIREIPNRIYERRKAEIIFRTLEGMKLHMSRGMEIDESELEKHIQNLFRTARILNDTDFEVQEGRLADDLISPIKPTHPKDNTDKVNEVFFLSPVIIPLLQERLLSFNHLLFTS
jgi:hypothetical protein